MESRAPPQHHHQHHQQPPQHHHHHQPMMLQQHHHQHQQQQQQQQHQHHHHHQHQQHHHHPTNTSYPTQNMPNSSSNPPPPPQMIATPNSSSSSMLQNNRFPFSSQVVSNTPPSKTPIEPLNSPYSGEGSSGLRPTGFGIDPNSSSSQKKKRGRPRKYSPDGGGSNIALGLSPTPISSSVGPPGGVVVAGGGGGGGGGQADSTGTNPSSENPSKRHRGRPPGSSKKQLDALGNCGVGFTPHVILVNAGEDIAAKIVAFSKQGPRTVCVLSANGSICNVSLRQPALSSGVVNYEGRYEIISLSGSFLFSESSGGLRTGGLSVSLAGSDGRVLGGGVAGMLMAATPVQIIVGSFIANGKKTKYMPSVPPSHLLNFSAPPLPAAESPPSQEDSSEESEENGSNHIDRNMGSYGHSNHPVHNIQMYNPMGWPNSASKMLQN